MIKWITIIFLLANVAYFGWQMNQRLERVVPTTASQKEITPASTKRLVLLSELDELPPLRNESVITGIEESEPSPLEEPANQMLAFNPEGSCLSIGPFESGESLEQLRSWLQIQNLPAKERIEEKRTRERYWVYLEPEDDAAAKARMDELKNKGLSDYYMISKGDMKNAISLGLFSSQDSVNRRLIELEKEGYNPVVVPQHKITRVYWVNAQIEEGLILPELPEGIEITNLDCLDIALIGSDQ